MTKSQTSPGLFAKLGDIKYLALFAAKKDALYAHLLDFFNFSTKHERILKGYECIRSFFAPYTNFFYIGART